MTWRRGVLFILAVLAFVFIRQRMPEMLTQDQHNTLKPSRTPASIAPPKTPSKSEGVEKSTSYYQMLEEDRFCEVLAASLGKDDHRQQFERSLRLEEDSTLQEMIGPSSPYITDASELNYKTPIARFYQALQLSQQITPSHAKLPNYIKARELLLELESEEPDNAAYPLYRLRVEQSMGERFEALLPIAEKIRNATEFNSHSLDVWRLVHERMAANASKYLVGISYITTLPMPDYVEALRIVKDLDAYVPGVRENLGLLMVREGQKATRSSNEGGYAPIEYSIGRSLLPWMDLPSHIELDRKLSGSNERGDFSIPFSALVDGNGNERKCDETSKVDFYAAIREIR